MTQKNFPNFSFPKIGKLLLNSKYTPISLKIVFWRNFAPQKNAGWGGECGEARKKMKKAYWWMKTSLMAASWLMDDDVPPPALSNRSREALRAPVTLSFSAAHGCAQSFATDALRLSRATGRWRMSSSSSLSSSTVVSPTNQRGDFSSSPSPAETRSASFPFSRIWLNAPRWVSSSVSFSPAVKFLRPLIRRSTCCQFYFIFWQRNRLLLADQSLVDFVDVHFFSLLHLLLLWNFCCSNSSTRLVWCITQKNLTRWYARSMRLVSEIWNGSDMSVKESTTSQAIYL